MSLNALLLITITVINPSSQEVTSDWFNLLPRVSDSWRLVKDPNEDEKLKILPQSGEATEYRVMILFPKKSTAYDTATAQILTTFGEKKLATEVSLNHFAGDQEKGLAALKEAEANQIDLIFSMGSKSTAFIVDNYASGKIPVVSVCSKDPVLMGQMPDYNNGSGSNLAFTSLDLPVRGQMAYLKRLRPNLNQIAVLYARNNTSAVKTQFGPLAELCARENIKVLEVVVEDQSQAAMELKTKVPAATQEMLAQDPTGENSIFWITGSTSVFREIRTINEGAAKIPVLSVVPNVVRAGDDSAVLSIGVSFENNAQIAALYAGRILTGQTKAGDLKVGVVSPPDIAINFKKARQIGLKIPFTFFESASFVYDHRGILVREKGQNVKTGP